LLNTKVVLLKTYIQHVTGGVYKI